MSNFTKGRAPDFKKAEKPPAMKPLPVTSMPDRADPKDPSSMDMKRGITSDREMKVTNGRRT